MIVNEHLVPASFRDPAGALFESDDFFVRKVKPSFALDVERVVTSDWMRKLVQEQKVISSEIVKKDDNGLELRHPKVPFVSYSWEWSFSALKSAALLTLDLELKARVNGFTLKDATSTNILFRGAHPIFVDALSFSRLDPEAPWLAFGQFCRSFLYPLLVYAHKGITPGPFLQAGLGEMSLMDASKILGRSSLFKKGVFKWVYLQRMLEGNLSSKLQDDEKVGRISGKYKVSPDATVHLIKSLQSLISGLNWDFRDTEWAPYAHNNSYKETEQEKKYEFVREALKETRPDRLYDLGANSGEFSLLAADYCKEVIALDSDPGALELLQRRGSSNIWTTYSNLAAPTPSLGWRLVERSSLIDRMNDGFFLALAVIHHLRISGGIPLEMIIRHFESFGSSGIVEWVGKDDAMVKRMLRNRDDVFFDYTKENFLEVLGECFVVVRSLVLKGGTRELFWVQRRKAH